MSNEQELRVTSEQFYAAVHAILHGDATPMLAMWSHSEEASYCDTRGEIVMGWSALERYWRQAAASNAAATTRLNATGQIMHAVIGGALAYVVALEEIRPEGASSVMKARATHVYRWEEDDVGGWRLLHRHADASPQTNVREQV